MVLSIFCSCNKEDNGGAETAPEGSENPPESNVVIGPAAEKEFLTTWLSAGYEKVQGGEEAPKNASSIRDLYMAKNEKESCTLSLRATKRVNSMKLEIEGLPANVSLTVYKEFMIPIKDKEYPDPLVESNLVVSVNANDTQSFLLQFETDKNTKAGDYPVKIKLNNKDGALVFEYTVTLHVWNFAYDDVLTNFGLSDIDEADLAKAHKIEQGTPEFEALYKNYYDLMLDYNFNAYELPYDILDDRADAYMSDPRVKSFRIDEKLPDATLKKIYNKLKTNPVWLEKAYFYPFDEPLTNEHQDQLVAACQRLENLCPDIKRVIPFYKNPNYHKDTSIDQIELLSQYTDIFCPKARSFDDSYIYTKEQKEKWGAIKTRMLNYKEEGYGLWWYVCWEPGAPFLNMYVNENGLHHRVLFWQQYLYGADAFLFWEINHWSGVNYDPWKDMATVKGLDPNVFGDGSLLYNGNHVKLDTAVPSLRLDIIRDGMEDFEMILLAKKYLGEAETLKLVKKVTKDLVNYTNSATSFESYRKAIGDAISAKLK